MASSRVLCTACGAAPSGAAPACPKCGGRTARVCGGCGHQNSVSKGYCDRCGSALGGPGPDAAAPTSPSLLAGDPSRDLPVTEIRRLPAAGSVPPPVSLPQAHAAAEPPGSAPLGDLWAPPPPPPQPGPTTIKRRSRIALGKHAARTFTLAAGALAVALGMWHVRERSRPESLVPRLGAEYLDALKLGDYGRAYEMFSARAKERCTAAEFYASRDGTPWDWSDLRIVHEEPGAILLAYRLKVAGRPDRDDHLLFTLEGDRWTRPYNWLLMRKAEDAFKDGDAPAGLAAAEAAAYVNPKDPMAWAYLCEAAHRRNLYQAAEQRCLTALALARNYPSNLGDKSLEHLASILAETRARLEAARRPQQEEE